MIIKGRKGRKGPKGLMIPGRFFRIGDLFRLVGSLLVATALCGCLSTAQAGPTEITYWTGWSGHELEVQRELIAQFEREHPEYRVRIMSVAGSYEKVTIAFAAGNPPDLMSSVWLEDLPSYAMRGAILPLDKYLTGSGRDTSKEFIPGIAQAMRYNGKTWGLMVSTGAQFVLANRKMLRDAGVDPDHPPKTTAELDAANEKLVKYDSAGNLIRFGWRPGPYFLPLTGFIFGGRWYDPETKKVTANDPRNVEALRYLAAYGKKYDGRKLMAYENALSGSNMQYVSDMGNFAGLFNGFAAMLFTGEYCQEFITRFAPKDFDYTFFPMPAPPGGRQNAFGLGGSVFVIPRDARHPEGGWELLNFLSSEAAVKKFCLGIKNMPPLVKLLDDPDFTSSTLQQFSAKMLKGENAFSPNGMPIWSYYYDQLKRVEQEAFLSGKDPQKLLDEVQRDVQEHLDKALKYAAN